MQSLQGIFHVFKGIFDVVKGILDVFKGILHVFKAFNLFKLDCMEKKSLAILYAQ